MKILIYLEEDAENLASSLKEHNVQIASIDEDIAGLVSDGSYDIVFVEGVRLIYKIRGVDSRIEIFVVGQDVENIMDIIEKGAFAYFSKPISLSEVSKRVETLDGMIKARRETARLEIELRKKYSHSPIIGKNPKIIDIFKLIRRFAPYYKIATITGETGTGKELVAQTIHGLSPAADKPFLVCNCGAFVETLVESELFGHVKGAFTGAVTDKKGVFEAAGEGTVFLDEIGELPLNLQPHFLRVLQEGEFKPVGSNVTKKIRCKIITATNRHLSDDVKSGRFREDLYFRLTAMVVNLPPLRERNDDILLIAKDFLEKFSNSTGKGVQGISIAAQSALVSYDWPGNVRELENAVEHAVMVTNKQFVDLADFPSNIFEKNFKESDLAASVETTLDSLIANHITAVLSEQGGNRTRAAEVLNISRRALQRKIEKYGLK